MFSLFASPAVAAHMGGHIAGLGFFFILVPLFFIGLLFLAGGLVRRRWSRDGGGMGHFGYGHQGAAHFGQGHAARGAESTLAERFAQGDIDEKEYRARLEVLRANNSFTTDPK